MALCAFRLLSLLSETASHHRAPPPSNLSLSPLSVLLTTGTLPTQLHTTSYVCSRQFHPPRQTLFAQFFNARNSSLDLMINVESVATEMRPVACLVAARMLLYVLVAHRFEKVSLELKLECKSFQRDARCIVVS